jgi:hypothetical protein
MQDNLSGDFTVGQLCKSFFFFALTGQKLSDLLIPKGKIENSIFKNSISLCKGKGLRFRGKTQFKSFIFKKIINK